MLQYQGVSFKKQLRCVCDSPVYWDEESNMFRYTCLQPTCDIHPDDIPYAMELTGNYTQDEIEAARKELEEKE